MHAGYKCACRQTHACLCMCVCVCLCGWVGAARSSRSQGIQTLQVLREANRIKNSGQPFSTNKQVTTVHAFARSTDQQHPQHLHHLGKQMHPPTLTTSAPTPAPLIQPYTCHTSKYILQLVSVDSIPSVHTSSLSPATSLGLREEAVAYTPTRSWRASMPLGPMTCARGT